eukprot:TRINITY_DN14273_c0_g2_i1.p1 TRINITY_DN14273_c0_g2~~TRINITY_DN14273_c0_g2_i1.p1  ORF type:complete len:158 (-),score=12.73 TRINITY_DN14273_c0_g2_i1:79-552(-)
MSSFTEFTGNIFFDELQLIPTILGLSHIGYINAVRTLASDFNYQIYGFAPCSYIPNQYLEFGLDRHTYATVYAAAVLTTMDFQADEQNLIKILNLLPQDGTPLPDGMDPTTGSITNQQALTLDITLTFLSIYHKQVRQFVEAAPWYPEVSKKFRQIQ